MELRLKPTKTKYVIALEDCEDVFVVKSTPEHILESVPKGKTTYANIISKALGITPRNALMHLVDLEKKGLFASENKVLKYKSGARAKARVFKRL